MAHTCIVLPPPSRAPKMATSQQQSSRPPLPLLLLLSILLLFSSSVHSRAFHPPAGLTFVRSNGRYWPLMHVYANSIDSPPSPLQSVGSRSSGEMLAASIAEKRAIMRLGKRAIMRLGRK